MLTTRDHATCGIFAILIYLSLKLALTPTLFSIFGWIMLFWNYGAFNVYCEQRKAGKF